MGFPPTDRRFWGLFSFSSLILLDHRQNRAVPSRWHLYFPVGTVRFP